MFHHSYLLHQRRGGDIIFIFVIDLCQLEVPFSEKNSNRNQTDTNEMATTETKYQTNFYSAKNIHI